MAKTPPFSVCNEFCVGGGGASNAKDVKYDNKKSGLAADNVGDAIDEVCGKMGDIDTSKNWNQNDPKEVDYIENRPFYEDGAEVKQLEDKFIPNTIARVADVDKKMNEAEENVDNKIAESLVPFEELKIKPTSQGSLHALSDSAEAPLQGMRIFGKTKQATTTGKQKLPYPYYHTTMTVNGITFTDNGDGSITISGTATNTAQFYFCTNFDWMQYGKTYRLYVPRNTSLSNIMFRYKKAGDEVYTYPYQITYGEGDDVDIACINVLSGVTVNETIYPIVVEGDSYDGNWEPFTGGMPSPSFSYKQDMKNDGDKGSMELFVKGKNLSPTSFIDTTQSIMGAIKYYDLSPATYTLSAMVTKFSDDKATNTRISANVCYTDGTNVVVQGKIDTSASERDGVARLKSVSFTVDSEKTLNYVSANILDYGSNGGVRNAKAENIQLEVGLKATPYEPPRPPQSLTIPTPNGLGGIPDIEAYDYIDLARGVRVQSTYDFIANGTEDWSILEHSGNALRQFYVYTDSGNGRPRSRYVPDKISCICNYYRAIDINSRQYNPYTAYIGLQSICVHDPDYLTVPAWKARLAELYANGTPLIIKYALETPNETPLSEEEISAYKALHTNYPNTTIYNDEGAYTEVKYVADTKNYVDNKIANEVAKLTAAIITE